MHSLQTGEIAANKALGCDVWAYFKQHPEESEVFNRSMSGMTASIEPAVLKAYDFGGLSTLVDVGGGHGIAARRHPRGVPALQGVVFDLPEVVEGATKRLTEARAVRPLQGGRAGASLRASRPGRTGT